MCAFIIVQNNKYFVLICSAERRSDTNLSTSHELSSVDVWSAIQGDREGKAIIHEVMCVQNLVNFYIGKLENWKNIVVDM